MCGGRVCSMAYSQRRHFTLEKAPPLPLICAFPFSHAPTVLPPLPPPPTPPTSARYDSIHHTRHSYLCWMKKNWRQKERPQQQDQRAGAGGPVPRSHRRTTTGALTAQIGAGSVQASHWHVRPSHHHKHQMSRAHSKVFIGFGYSPPPTLSRLYLALPRSPLGPHATRTHTQHSEREQRQD